MGKGERGGRWRGEKVRCSLMGCLTAVTISEPRGRTRLAFGEARGVIFGAKLDAKQLESLLLVRRRIAHIHPRQQASRGVLRRLCVRRVKLAVSKLRQQADEGNSPCMLRSTSAPAYCA